MSKGGGKEKGEDHHDEEIVSINVGGQVFVTTTTTLRNDTHSMLYAMFSGRYPSRKDPQGFHFIDRDGKHFRCIHNNIFTFCWKRFHLIICIYFELFKGWGY